MGDRFSLQTTFVSLAGWSFMWKNKENSLGKRSEKGVVSSEWSVSSRVPLYTNAVDVMLTVTLEY